MKVIIVGAGLGGFSAAICLRQQGHEVRVFERKDRLWTIGGAIFVTPNAIQMFTRWGLNEQLALISEATALSNQRDLMSGDIYRAIPLGEGRDALPRLTLRSDLIKMLYARAVELGAEVSFSSTVVDIHETSVSASVELENDASEQQADLVIVADGVRSRMRSKFLGSYVTELSELDPQPTGRTYYGLTFRPSTSPEFLSKCKVLTEVSPPSLNFWGGRDDKFAISLYNSIKNDLFVIFSLNEPTNMKSLWDEEGDVAYVREKFLGICHPEFEQALDAAEVCERWALSQMPDLPRWRSKEGRIVLLGDAAHAFLPTAGQGFSSIVEEVSVLGLMLEKRGQDLASATEAWESVCKPRSKRLKGLAHLLTRQYEGDPDVLKDMGAQTAREAEMRKTNPKLDGVVGDMNASYASPEFRRWVTDYDPLDAGRRYLAGQQTNGETEHIV